MQIRSIIMFGTAVALMFSTPTLGVCPTGVQEGDGIPVDDDTLTLSPRPLDQEDGADEEDGESDADKGARGGTGGGNSKGNKGNKGNRRNADLNEAGSGNSGSSGSSEEPEEQTRRVAISVKGQSGKFSIYDADADSAACDPNTITVTMDALHERDADGNAVGSSGKVKHSIQTFAPQKFTFATPEDNVEIGTATATKVSFSTPFKGLENSALTIDTYVMTHSGVVGTDTEAWSVASGDVKFNLALSDWYWCGVEAGDAACSQGQTQQVGAFVDVVISVKGGGQSKPAKGGKSVSIGGGATIELSNRVFVDGAWTTMPEGFPQVEAKGSSTIFTFRFPKFETSALYDPVVKASNIEPLVPAGSSDVTGTDVTTDDLELTPSGSAGLIAGAFSFINVLLLLWSVGV